MRKCFFALFISVALQAAPLPADAATRLVLGTVVSVNPQDSSVKLRQGNILGYFGYLRIGVKSYQVTQVSLLRTLRPGDRITGVFLQKDGMLHRVRRVNPSRVDKAKSRI